MPPLPTTILTDSDARSSSSIPIKEHLQRKEQTPLRNAEGALGIAYSRRVWELEGAIIPSHCCAPVSPPPRGGRVGGGNFNDAGVGDARLMVRQKVPRWTPSELRIRAALQLGQSVDRCTGRL